MMYRVKVCQEDNMVSFMFNQLSDAIDFMSECMEVGEKDTEACIMLEKEDE